jgi:hypothetical protein
MNKLLILLILIILIFLILFLYYSKIQVTEYFINQEGENNIMDSSGPTSSQFAVMCKKCSDEDIDGHKFTFNFVKNFKNIKKRMKQLMDLRDEIICCIENGDNTLFNELLAEINDEITNLRKQKPTKEALGISNNVTTTSSSLKTTTSLAPTTSTSLKTTTSSSLKTTTSSLAPSTSSSLAPTTTSSSLKTTTSLAPSTSTSLKTTTSLAPSTSSSLAPTTTSSSLKTTTSLAPTTTTQSRIPPNSGIIELTPQCSPKYCSKNHSDCKRPCWEEILFHELLPTKMVHKDNYFFIKHYMDETYLYYDKDGNYGYSEIIGYNKKFRFNIDKISERNNEDDWKGADSNGYIIYPNDINNIYLTLSDGEITFESKIIGDSGNKQIFIN